MDGTECFMRHADEHARVLDEARRVLAGPFQALAGLAVATLSRGGKLILFGNGGSAADAQHIAAEIVGRFRRERAPMPALALTTDSSVLTAIANDYGYDEIFARQIRALGQAGDLAIGISTSGRSPNVLAALRAARDCGIAAAALGGGDGGGLAGLADPLLLVPSANTARIQEIHILLGHALCDLIEAQVGRER